MDTYEVLEVREQEGRLLFGLKSPLRGMIAVSVPTWSFEQRAAEYDLELDDFESALNLTVGELLLRVNPAQVPEQPELLTAKTVASARESHTARVTGAVTIKWSSDLVEKLKATYPIDMVGYAKRQMALHFTRQKYKAGTVRASQSGFAWSNRRK